MNKLGTIARPRPLLLSGTYWRSTSSAVEHRIDFMSFGIDLGRGGLSVPGWAMEWRMSDERLLSVRDYDLGSHVYGRSGRISVRAPYVGPPRSATGAPTQAGAGSVGLSRPTQRRSLLRGIGVWTTPPAETEGAGISSIWAAQTGIVDVTVKGTPNSPGYRIHGSGLYGPTGYWITKDRSGIRIGVPVDLQWYAADFETTDIWYAVSVNGIDIASGSMASGSIRTVRYTFPSSGSYAVSVELRDSNGVVATLQGPSIGVIDAPILDGAFLTRSLRTRERSTVDVEIFVSSGCAWSIHDADMVVAAGQSSVASRLVFPWTPSIGVHVLSLVLSDAYGSLDPISGPVITVVPWRDVISL